MNRIVRSKLTPSELAKRWGISPDKVLVWIRNGELRAIDASTRRGGRPRYLIDELDIATFEERRAVAVTGKCRKKRRRDVGIIEFF